MMFLIIERTFTGETKAAQRFADEVIAAQR